MTVLSIAARLLGKAATLRVSVTVQDLIKYEGECRSNLHICEALDRYVDVACKFVDVQQLPLKHTPSPSGEAGSL
jgi:hypothetical protein